MCDQGFGVDPLLHIRAARSSSNAATIPQVRLSNIRIRGILQQSGDMALLLPDGSQNVRIEGTELICTVACDFAAEAGDYEFTVSAAGYQSKTVTVTGVRPTQFESSGPGCITRGFGGVDVSIVLDPA